MKGGSYDSILQAAGASLETPSPVRGGSHHQALQAEAPLSKQLLKRRTYLTIRLLKRRVPQRRHLLKRRAPLKKRLLNSLARIRSRDLWTPDSFITIFNEQKTQSGGACPLSLVWANILKVAVAVRPYNISADCIQEVKERCASGLSTEKLDRYIQLLNLDLAGVPDPEETSKLMSQRILSRLFKTEALLVVTQDALAAKNGVKVRAAGAKFTAFSHARGRME